MKKYISIPVACFFTLIFGLISCDLDKEIDINLPPYESQPVVEAYLIPGEQYRLLLTESSDFFDSFIYGSNLESLQKLLVEDADVTIEYNGEEILLQNQLLLDQATGKVYNYISDKKVPADFTGRFELHIILPDEAGQISGETSIPAIVPIDSIVIEVDEDDEEQKRILTYLTDDTLTVNYYRRMLHNETLDSVPEQDFLVDDQFSDNGILAFGTGYEYELGDTVINTIYHLTSEHFDYLTSVFNSIAANENPFGQPGVLDSNIGGSANPIGIFTGLTYVRDTTIIE